MKRLCGHYIPDPIFLNDNSVTLNLKTDESVPSGGFDLVYVASTQSKYICFYLIDIHIFNLTVGIFFYCLCKGDREGIHWSFLRVFSLGQGVFEGSEQTNSKLSYA